MRYVTAPVLTIGSLFSGIGGLERGFQAACDEAGIASRVAWQVEQAEYPRRVLAKHWPDADRSVTDVRAAGRAVHQPVDALVFGFPCPDISYNGRGAGIDGTRSGLWIEGARVIRELRPRFVIVENVTALLSRGMDRVLGDLAALGYDALWECISARDVGFPHERDRIFIAAWREWSPIVSAGSLAECECCDDLWCERCASHYVECRCPGPHSNGDDWYFQEEAWGSVAYPDGERMAGRGSEWIKVALPHARAGLPRSMGSGSRGQDGETEPGLVRCVDGVSGGLLLRERSPARLGEPQFDWEPARLIDKRTPHWKERIEGDGNVVVPHVAREIGRTLIREFLQ